jgi:hypothetical protein
MDATRVLVIAGAILLSTAALLGFVQERQRDRPKLFAAWRVVHSGGTAGAVQLLALASLWQRLAGSGLASSVLACTLAAVTWAFFLGPLAHVLGRPRLARVLTTAGAVPAVPAYLALPFVLL